MKNTLFILLTAFLTACACIGCASESNPADTSTDQPLDDAGGDQPDTTGTERCNGRDDDGDTLIDEDFDLLTDLNNCGECGNACSFQNATALCRAGECEMGPCREQYYDLNGSNVDGCEYRCPHDDEAEDPARTCEDDLDNDCDGLIDVLDPDCQVCVDEVCNGRDDDCDEEIDEGFDLMSDIENCGECGNVCPPVFHAHPICVMGICGYECDAGWTDANGEPGDGCEEECTPTGLPETECDGVDDDCDGDEDEDFEGGECGVGVCATNYVCLDGTEICDEGDPTGDDTDCNGVDDDCDGVEDDAFVPTMVCGVGACRREGVCALGIETCTAGEPESTDMPDNGFLDANCDEIDGDIVRAIFVAGGGLDSNPGTMLLPKRTVQAGINAAFSSPTKDHVYVSVGDYDEQILLRDGISVFGGYDAADGWSRASDHTVIVDSPATVAVVADGISSPTRVGWLTIRSSDASDAGDPAYGVKAVNSTGLVVEYCSVQSGGGADGDDGTEGGPGEGYTGNPGMRGDDGDSGCEYGCHCSPLCACGSCSMPGVGVRGTNSHCSRHGGNGGSPGGYTSSGLQGQPGVGGAPGGGGGPATCSGDRGHNGTDGTSPSFSTSWNGAAGNGDGSIPGTDWVASDGSDGTRGTHGGGAGGGGGGGGDCSESCLDGWCTSYGGAGGGGGAGGCGGYHGTMGTGGGGAFAIFLVNSSVEVRNCQISTGGGGNGGQGRSGGAGGQGGPGGSGGAQESTDQGGFGGNGGTGGTGAQGGAGGGGGGGPSIGIARYGSSTLTESGNTYSLGSAGNGGNSPGNSGANGRRSNTYAF